MCLILPEEIKTIYPIAVIKPKKSGRTVPIEIQCNNGNNGVISNYVVKLYTSFELGYFCCAKELLGSLLAIAFGINTPEPAIIDISSQYCGTLKSNNGLEERIKTSSGLSFASKLIETGAMEFQFLENDLIQDAFEIFAFDALIMNFDRRKEKPNMFQQPDKLIVFDHELAFQYAHPHMMIGGVPEPWYINTPAIKNHALYKFLHKSDIFYDSFIDKLGELSDGFIDTIFSYIPDEWNDETALDNIKKYLLNACMNKDKFLRGLKEVLS